MPAKWTQSEIDYLIAAWGRVAMPTMSKRLARSIRAIQLKANRLRLGGHLQCDDRMPVRELLSVVYGRPCNSELAGRLARQGMPVRRHTINKRYISVIDLDAFWAWAEGHQRLLNFSRFECGALGVEPAWVAAKRRRDAQAGKRSQAWTSHETAMLVAMLREHRYTYADIRARLQRTQSAISNRIWDLGLKDRVAPMARRPWTNDETRRAGEMRRSGHSCDDIASALGRTEFSVRQRLRREAIG